VCRSWFVLKLRGSTEERESGPTCVDLGLVGGEWGGAAVEDADGSSAAPSKRRQGTLAGAALAWLLQLACPVCGTMAGEAEGGARKVEGGAVRSGRKGRETVRAATRGKRDELVRHFFTDKDILHLRTIFVIL
jgi:hypothetical protein